MSKPDPTHCTKCNSEDISRTIVLKDDEVGFILTCENCEAFVQWQPGDKRDLEIVRLVRWVNALLDLPGVQVPPSEIAKHLDDNYPGIK